MSANERVERYTAAALTLLREVAHDVAHTDPSAAEELRSIVDRIAVLVGVRG